MIVSSGPQLAPRTVPDGTGEIVIGGPPRIETFLRVLSSGSLKPTQALSGETNGADALAAWSGVAGSCSSDRTARPRSAPAPAKYTTRVPSGEMAMSWLLDAIPSTSDAAVAIARRVTRDGGGSVKRQTARPVTTANTIPATHGAASRHTVGRGTATDAAACDPPVSNAPSSARRTSAMSWMRCLGSFWRQRRM